MAETPPKMDLAKELAKGVVVHRNLQQEIIVTTTDRMRLCLMRHQAILSGRTAWIAPLGILSALVGVLVAADFRDRLFLDKDQWKLIFTIGIGASAVWLLFSLLHSGRNLWVSWKKGAEGTVDDILNELKATTPEVATLITEPMIHATPMPNHISGRVPPLSN